MKKLGILSLVAAASLFGSSLIAETLTVEVSGMTCSGCTKVIKKKLEGNDKVEKAEIDLSTGKASIVTKEGMKLTRLEVQEMIEAAGYKIKSK